MSLSVQKLSHSYSHGKCVLDNVSLEVGNGELVALVGRSGCGKTTLLHCVAGLLTPSSGGICIDEEDISNKKPNNRGIGIMMQDQPLYEHLSVEKNIAFPLRALGNKSSVTEIIKQLQLEEIAGQNVSLCSGGERRRVALGRAIVLQPRVLLLDEPFVSLDEQLRESLQQLIRTVHAACDTSTLFVTHDVQDAESFADRIVTL